MPCSVYSLCQWTYRTELAEIHDVPCHWVGLAERFSCKATGWDNVHRASIAGGEIKCPTPPDTVQRLRYFYEASVVCVGSSTARESRMKFRAGEHDHSYSAPPVISGFPCVIVSIAEGQRCYHGQKKAPCLKIRRREKTV